jgi:hypothetical protein
MYRIILTALVVQLNLLPLLTRPPDMAGLATWYGPPGAEQGDPMADGHPFDLAGATVAVDRGRRDLLGRRALVLADCGKLALVRVTDTGMLDAAGKVRFGVGPLEQTRYWPAERIDVKWSDGAVAMPFVADFPRDFFRERVACSVDGWGRGETTVVAVWLLPE